MFEYFRQERLLFEVWPIFLLSPKISLFLLVGSAAAHLEKYLKKYFGFVLR
jgi:hypothetical protein